MEIENTSGSKKNSECEWTTERRYRRYEDWTKEKASIQDHMNSLGIQYSIQKLVS